MEVEDGCPLCEREIKYRWCIEREALKVERDSDLEIDREENVKGVAGKASRLMGGDDEDEQPDLAFKKQDGEVQRTVVRAKGEDVVSPDFVGCVNRKCSLYYEKVFKKIKEADDVRKTRREFNEKLAGLRKNQLEETDKSEERRKDVCPQCGGEVVAGWSTETEDRTWSKENKSGVTEETREKTETLRKVEEPGFADYLACGNSDCSLYVNSVRKRFIEIMTESTSHDEFKESMKQEKQRQLHGENGE
ncbi:MAG: hypothetical protein ABEK59_02555 [Halobacteria archaeon]